MTLENYRDKLNNCDKKWVLLKCKGCGLEYITPISCGLRTCPKCAKKQSNELFFNIWNVVKRLRETKIYKLRHITLTYGNKGSLWSDLRESKKAFRKLWHNYLEKKGAGALVCVEIGDKNRSVHLHVLYFGMFVFWKQLSKEWKKVTGGRWEIDVRLVKGKKGIREVTKYISKGIYRENKDLENMFEIEEALKGMRRIMTYGIFYDYKLPEPVFTCPVCGCEHWEYVRRYTLNIDINKETIRDILYRFKTFQKENARASPDKQTVNLKQD